MYGPVMATEVRGVIIWRLLGKLFLYLKKRYKEENIPLLSIVMFDVLPGIQQLFCSHEGC